MSKSTKNKTKTKSARRGIHSPAATAVATLATTKAGHDTIVKTADGFTQIIKWTIIGTVVIGSAVVAYKIYKNRFVPMRQNLDAPRPTITASVARVKADSIYNAMFGPGANFSQVKNLLLGLNYNDFVLVYNAFGKRMSAVDKMNPSSWFAIGNQGMTLTEWLIDQFKNGNQLADLRAILPNGII